MVTKKIVSLFAMMFMCLSIFSATDVQKVYLKNGSVFSGYIQKQNPNGDITISTKNAIVCVDASASVTNEKAYPLTELDSAWVKWAEKNDKVQMVDGIKSLTLADVKVANGKAVSKVRIIERGTVVKYVEQTPNTYTYKWSEVEAVRADKRAKNMLSGINRVYQLADGTDHEGEYAEETDSTLSLYMSDGSRMSFKTLNVVKYTFKAINPNQSLFEQAPLIDIVETKNNAKVEGVIVEQNYTSNSNDKNYILMEYADGKKDTIKISDVKAVSKRENELYAPMYDIILKPGEVVVNRQPVALYTLTDKRNMVMVLDNYSGADSDPKTIELNVSNGNSKYAMEYNGQEMDKIENFKLVKLVRLELKKNIYYGFSYKNLVKSISPIKMEKSVNNTIKVEFDFSECVSGIYAIYNSVTENAIPVIVKK